MLDPNIKIKTKNIVIFILNNLFIDLFIGFLILGLLEIFKPGLLLNYFSLSIILMVIILLGAFNILFIKPETSQKKKIKLLDYITLFLLSVIFGIFIIYFLKSMGVLSIAVGICAMFISFLFIILSIKEKYD